MPTTTTYGTWTQVMGLTSFEECLASYAGEFTDDFDMDGVASDWSTLIDEVLPGSMLLVSDQFIGDVDDEEIPDEWISIVREGIQNIDLEPIFRAREIKEPEQDEDISPDRIGR